MPPRLKSTGVVAFMLLAIYLLFASNYGSSFYGGVGEHVIQGTLGEGFYGEVVVLEETVDTPNPESPSSVPAPDNESSPDKEPDQDDEPDQDVEPDQNDEPDQDDDPDQDDRKAPGEKVADPVVNTKPQTHEGDNLRPTPTRLSQPYKIASKHPLSGEEATAAPPAATKSPIGDEKGIPDKSAPDVDNGAALQAQFEKDSKDLDKVAGAGLIYGTTLKALNGSGSHEGFKATALTPTEFWSTYSDKRPYVYNPYPDYNSRSWKQHNRGKYNPCMSLKGEAADLKVYSGHAEPFVEPPMGSFKVFELDFNLCYERGTRLGPYGLHEGPPGEGKPTGTGKKGGFDWDAVDWGLLQRKCFEKNANRYASAYQQQQIIDHGTAAMESIHDKNSTSHFKRVDVAQDGKYDRSEAVGEEKPVSTSPGSKVDASKVSENEHADHQTYKSPTVTSGKQDHSASKNPKPKVNSEEIVAEGESIEDEQIEEHKQSAGDITEEKSRSAVLIRATAGQNFTENDKQNIRAMIAELGLRSGGEYQIFLLVHVKDDKLPIWKDRQAYDDVVEVHIPQEFWNITILWNDEQMKELYPKISKNINSVQQSQWLPVQKFAQDNPEFGSVWNWEFESRYTGHYYDFFEKVDIFARAQPRKYLWERNERYFIPSFHGPWAKFMKTVEAFSGSESVWGPMPNVLAPAGPPRKTMDPKEDRYTWGVDEAADYISFSPIFNPANTSWAGKDDIWGYDGNTTPRRATVGITSRCSRKLLNIMHHENLKGNHINSEMAPQTVSLLHGLKAVYAPIPMFFDKPWSGISLQKYFNPGARGLSGTSGDSPFGKGKESRFQGSTWHPQAEVPMRLYNNWLGYEERGIGGPEWEKANGRVCLPPMLLHPIKDVVDQDLENSSDSSESEKPGY